MEEFKLYSVSDDYVEWLRKDFPNVYSNKINSRTHTRKYLGVVLQIGQYLYYVPMSSPKDSDYQIAGAPLVLENLVLISHTQPLYHLILFDCTSLWHLK